MRIQLTVLATLGLLLCCCALPAYPQEKCTLQTFTGTYAFYDKGSSSVLDLSQPSAIPLHFAGVVAPFLALGEVTFSRQGVGDGFYWMYIGAFSSGFNPLPVHVTITEMNEDCSGKLQYSVVVPNLLSANIEERFVLFDNGREYRSLPTSIQNGIPTLTWLGTGRRIGRPGEAAHYCGPHSIRGTYLLSTENILDVSDLVPHTAMADAVVLRENVSMTGDYTGTAYEKTGFYPFETAAQGTYAVNADCSFSSTLYYPEYSLGPMVVKGVLFDQGKEFYALALPDVTLPVDQQGFKYSFVYAKRIGD